MAATLDAKIRLDSSQFSGGLNRAMRETNAAVGKMSAQFGTLKNVMAGGLVGSFFTNIIGGLFDASMQTEKLEAALAATAGSMGLGKRQLQEVRTLAGDIGLNINSAAKSMIQFQSAGMSSAEALKAIGSGYNAILSTGGGAAEFERFAVAIQQLRTSPKPLQEEVNQLRDALPTTAKLMQETFGVSRAEDLQRLNISGRQFVETLLDAMGKLPQVGDTLEKQIGRSQAKVESFKAKLGDTLRPMKEIGMDAASALMDAMDGVAKRYADFTLRWQNADPDAIRAETEARVNTEERVERQKRAIRDYNQAEKQAATSKAKSIEQGQTLAKVYDGFNRILAETARLSREASAELNFEDRMRAFTDQERENDWQKGLDETRQKTADAIRAKREAAADANTLPFYGPQQMTDDEREDWRRRVDREGMTRSDRKAERAAKREQEENTRKAADRKTREQMREIEKEKRNSAFDDLKKNKGFFDEEGTKRKLREKNREDAKHAVQSAAQTLTDIKAILQTLATA
jgi:tape measure domain-containing protein